VSFLGGSELLCSQISWKFPRDYRDPLRRPSCAARSCRCSCSRRTWVAAGEGSPTENGHAVDQGGPSLGAGTAVGGLDTADCHTLDGDQLRATGRVVAGIVLIKTLLGWETGECC
jgi:hypothetical protein